MKEQMDAYHQLYTILHHNHPFDQFASQLHSCQPKHNPILLGKLLIEIVQLKKSDFYHYLNEVISYGGNINFIQERKSGCSRSVLMTACQSSNIEIVQFLMGFEDINIFLEDQNQQNALHYAIRNPSEQEALKIFKTILQKFPKLIKANQKGTKPMLIQAIQRKNISILTLLLSNGCDPNYQNPSTGNTSLHEALLSLSSSFTKQVKEVAKVLMRYGARSGILNHQKQDAQMIAHRYNFDLSKVQKQVEEEFEEEEKKTFSEACSMNAATRDEDIYSRYTDDLRQSQFSSDEEDLFPQIDMQMLEDQIEAIGDQSQIQIEKAWKDVEYIYEKLIEIGRQLHLTTDLIGSYATKLWTPESDIDVVYVQGDKHQPAQKTLKIIYKILKERAYVYKLQKVYLNMDYKFPNISIIINGQIYRRKVDICVFHYKNNGQKYVKFINQQLKLNPYIKPLFYVFRRFIKNFKLNNPSKGGIKTYALFLMLMYGLQALPAHRLGQAFMNVIYYFSYIFQYEEYFDEQKNYKLRFNLIDPLNHSNNVGGRHTDTEKLKEMFKIIDYGLRLKMGTTDDEVLPYLFNLNKMMQE